MDQNNLYKKDLRLACNTSAPPGARFVDMNDEIKILREYLGKQFNNLEVTKELKDKANEINFFERDGFEDWLKKRSDFYKSEWDKLIKNEKEIINNYIFLSETFKILNKCSWWVQNAYQPFCNEKVKIILRKLDCIARDIEESNSTNNKRELILKAKKIAIIEPVKKVKNWKAVLQSKLSKKEHEKERQLFSMFAELLAYNDLIKNGFRKIEFLPEQKTKQPDFIAEKNGNKFYIEVKQIRRTSKEDDALRSNLTYSGFGSANFRQPLQKKVEDLISDTDKKFNSVVTKNRILILDYQDGFDIIRLPKEQRNLLGIFGADFFKKLENTFSMSIWLRKYF